MADNKCELPEGPLRKARVALAAGGGAVQNGGAANDARAGVRSVEPR